MLFEPLAFFRSSRPIFFAGNFYWIGFGSLRKLFARFGERYIDSGGIGFFLAGTVKEHDR
jgi:hypothetical protein